MSESRPEPRWRIALFASALLAALTVSLYGQPGRPGRRAARVAMVEGREAAADEVLVKYRGEQAPDVQAAIESPADLDETEPVGGHELRRLHSRSLNTAQLLTHFRARSDVEYVEPNYVIRAAISPNDGFLPLLWGLLNTGQNILGVNGVSGADINATAA